MKQDKSAKTKQYAVTMDTPVLNISLCTNRRCHSSRDLGLVCSFAYYSKGRRQGRHKGTAT